MEASEFLKNLIETAAAPTPETPQSLLDLAVDGRADLWFVHEHGSPFAVSFSQPLQRPKGLVLNVLAAAGTQGPRWFRTLRGAMAEDGKHFGAKKMICIRTTGCKTCFGLKPVGYYYEDEI